MVEINWIIEKKTFTILINLRIKRNGNIFATK